MYFLEKMLYICNGKVWGCYCLSSTLHILPDMRDFTQTEHAHLGYSCLQRHGKDIQNAQRKPKPN